MTNVSTITLLPECPCNNYRLRKIGPCCVCTFWPYQSRCQPSVLMGRSPGCRCPSWRRRRSGASRAGRRRSQERTFRHPGKHFMRLFTDKISCVAFLLAVSNAKWCCHLLTVKSDDGNKGMTLQDHFLGSVEKYFLQQTSINKIVESLIVLMTMK